MAITEHQAQLAQAWAHHREHRNEQARDEFNHILRSDSNNIDALYGLGLAERALHNTDAAKQAFERCLALVKQALEKNPGEDRPEMLERFIHQRLAEMGA